jgi:cytochrome c
MVAAGVTAACSHAPPAFAPPQVPGGSPQRGAADIEYFGCGACHVIPGIRGATGKVGPPLTDFAQRGYIAGELPNNGANLIRWIMDPRGVEPGTDMPDLGVSDQRAADIAAYLYTLGG